MPHSSHLEPTSRPPGSARPAGSRLALRLALLVAGCTQSVSPLGDGGTAPDAGPVAPDASWCGDIEAACTLSSAADLSITSSGALDLADARPAADIDYLELRSGPTVLSSRGTACDGATDVTACMSALEAIPNNSGFGNGCGLPSYCPLQLVVTRGDEVFAVTAHERMTEVLGSIDTATEAALVVWAFRPVGVGTAFQYFPEEVGELPGGGYDVIVQYLESDCVPIISRSARLTVGADASVITTDCDHITSCTTGCV